LVIAPTDIRGGIVTVASAWTVEVESATAFYRLEGQRVPNSL
jgi:hypothetical protein